MQQTLPGTSHVSHSNLGKDWEATLDRTHHFYSVQKIARVRQNPVKWVYIGKSEYDKLKDTRGEIVAVSNTGRYLKKAKSDIDFTGVFKGGRGIFFDAKQTKGKSFPLSNVANHQIENLMEKREMNAVSGLMIHFSDVGRAFFVPAEIVDKANIEMLYKRGRKSLAIADLEREAIEIPLDGNLADWAKVLNK